MMLGFVFYLITFALFISIIYLFIKNLEYLRCIHKLQIPFVPSARVLRRAVVNDIKTNYPMTKSVCDIGGGYGGLSRQIARKCNVRVTSLENMPFTYGVSKILDVLTGVNVETIFVDAFTYLDDGKKFDIGVAYLGPNVNPALAKYIKNFKVLIVLDVPIADLPPTRTVDIGHGYTTYGFKHKYPHKLFIYES